MRFSKLYSLKPLHWVLLSTFWLDVLRITTVPLGGNIDEGFHLKAILAVTNELKLCFTGTSCQLSKLSTLGGGSLDILRGMTYYIPLGVVLSVIPKLLTEPEIFYILRFFSIIIHLATLVCAYQLCQKIFPNRSTVPMLIIGVLSFIPSYGDMMSGITIEISVALIGSLGLATFANLLSTKPTFYKTLLTGGLMILAYATKGTAWIVIFVATTIFFLTLPNFLKLAFCSLAVIGISIYVYFSPPFILPQQASWFYLRRNFSPVEISPKNSRESSALGIYSLLAHSQYDSLGYNQYVTASFVQYLPEQVVPSLHKATIICGAWVRADSNNTAKIIPPSCGSVNTFFPKTNYVFTSNLTSTSQISSDWTFINQRFEVDDAATEVGYFLGLPENNVILLFDGAVLVKGDIFLGDEIPVFLDSGGRQVKWGNNVYQNLLRNPSGEQIWWLMQPQAGFPYLVNDRFAAILDWQRTLPAWIRLIRWLLTNFWSSFSGLLAGLTSRQMILLALATAMALVGNVKIILWNLPKRLPPYNRRSNRLIYIMLLSTALIALGLVLYRADLVAYEEKMLIWSSMRHAATGQIAFAALLALGWWEWFPQKWQRPLSAIVILTLYLIAIYIFLKIQYPFQHCAYTQVELCLYSLY